ncbi:MAG: DNA helicase RecQ [Clostridia bacterium]|nr:DNA helicase RecQ [Clostridia bacterium]NCC84372.1 DNA helicase RecQ [Clostridia bacterium]
MNKHTILHETFGFADFRPAQAEIIDELLANRDVLGVMPTGAGKSLCYQVPALLMSGVTLVVSPLISLMKDQVQALGQNGIRAAYINSSLTAAQNTEVIRRAADRHYRLIYVAPERLLTPAFLELCQRMPVSMLTIDEAHCISQWGNDFRPSYMKIQDFLARLPVRPVISAFTATATAEVRDDIVHLLGLKNPRRIVTGFDRENLFFSVQKPKDKDQALLKIIRTHPNETGIVYCSTRKAVEEVTEFLQQNRIEATRYHAGLDEKERHQNQDDFLFDRATVMVATNAFGMGIDKSNVSFVIHYNMPMDVESYYQEAGRAGRDGSPADCVVLYSGQDVKTNTFLIDRKEPNPDLSDLQQLLSRQRDHDRLKAMTFYCTSHTCLRASILRYFGETAHSYCGHCSNCQTEFKQMEVTHEAKAILATIYRLAQRRSQFGKTMIIDVLLGSKNERILRAQLDTLAAYGFLQASKRTILAAIVDQLQEQGYLAVTGTTYPVLTLTDTSREILQGDEPVFIMVPKEKPKTKAHRRGALDEPETATQPDQDLFARLKALRSTIAREEHIPAYMVFTDATLTDMCRKTPHNLTQLLDVSGVGAQKSQRYGQRFLHEIGKA